MLINLKVEIYVEKLPILMEQCGEMMKMDGKNDEERQKKTGKKMWKNW